MTIYLVCENVDLGYHVLFAKTDKAAAEAVCAEMTKERLDSVERNLRAGNYTDERIAECMTRMAGYCHYEVDEVVVDCEVRKN